ncbi:MAG: hypothetical protein OEU40_16525 [Gammaproteobacteria bacterium]|jgi:hypothetical protein|nr:hypothetical protein [Gammaproteobacteria bacterium]
MKAFARFLCVLSLTAICVACDGGGSQRQNSTPCVVGDTEGIYVYTLLGEAEPNNVISMANRIQVPGPDPFGKNVAILVAGRIHDTQDRVDTFALTASRTIGYFFKLCDSCYGATPTNRFGILDSLDTSIAYFDVLDAVGNILMSTKGKNSKENYLEMCVNRNTTIYIMLVATDTNNELQDYGFSGFETF